VWFTIIHGKTKTWFYRLLICPLLKAPEILRYEKYDAKADLWSVGAIAYEMVFGSPPYRAENHVHLLRAIESANESALPFPDSIRIKKLAYSSNFASAARKPSTMSLKIESSDLFRKFLLLLLKKNPSERISFEDFFEHSIVKESIETTGAIQTNSSFKETFADVSFNQPVRASSIDSVIESVLRASEDENNTCSIMELFENIDRKPAVFETLVEKYFSYLLLVVYHSSEISRTVSGHGGCNSA
jgi:serine/threonine protein kinase